VRLPRVKTIVIPTWREDEIQRLKAAVPANVVHDRFQRMRGLPRWVCDAPAGYSEDRQETQIQNFSFASLKALMQSKSYDQLPKQFDKADPSKSTDVIIRLEPQPDDDSKVKTMVTSDYVEVELAYRFVDSVDFDVQVFVSATLPYTTLAHFRGYSVEAYAHRSLTRANDLKMTLRQLSAQGKPVENQAMSLPKPALKFPQLRVYTDLKDEISIVTGAYNRPKRKNEPTVDSWAVVKRELVQEHFGGDAQLEDESVKFFAVFFQITVAESHIVDGTVLKRIIAWIKSKLQVQKLGVVFVFVTTDNGIRKMQTVSMKVNSKTRKPFKNQDQFGCQYAIQLRGPFENLAKAFQDERIAMEGTTQAEFDDSDVDIVTQEDESDTH